MAERGLLGGGAAFGMYPQMKPRRQGNPADSANLPIDVLRGRLAGLLGAPADIANLLRSPSPTEMFGDVSYEAPAQFSYTTEKFLKDLPLAPTSRVGEVAGQAASFVPLNPMPAVRGMQKIGQMAGEELAATMMGQRPGSMMSKVVPQPLFAVPPEQGLFQAKPQAPVSDIGFYSAAEQAALNLARNKGTGQSFINDLMKAPDVKKEELAYTGLDDFLRDKPNVTKQEVQDFLANNRVDVQEVRLGEAAAEDPIGIAKRKEIFDKYEPQIQALYKDMDSYRYDTPREVLQSTDNRLRKLQEMRDAEANAYYVIPESTPTRYQKYQLAGGENYREILLTLPQKKNEFPDFEQWITNRYGGSQVPDGVRQAARKEYERQSSGLEISGGYQSSHFNEPNILAHIRVNDRIDADGKKMLLVEEIQSDWHQAGREKGYGPKMEKSVEAYYETKDGQRIPIGFGKTKEEAEAAIDVGWKNLVDIKYETTERKIGEGVPDAPFKDTWYQLALKRLTKYAADNGYERIGLTTGKQQSGRYALTNEVDEINVIGRTDARTGEKSRSVALDLKSGATFKLGVNNNGIIDNVNMLEINNLQGKKLADVVGKDIAKQIMEGSSQTIKGEGLNIGGEGMMKYYDEIYPKFLDKYGKKYGASVGETKVNTVMERADNSMIPKMGQEPVRYIDVTPQMKEGTSKGQPLFAAVPALPLASVDYTDPFPDTTR